MFSEEKPFLPLLGDYRREPVATCGLGGFLHGRCLDSAPVRPLSILDNLVLSK